MLKILGMTNTTTAESPALTSLRTMLAAVQSNKAKAAGDARACAAYDVMIAGFEKKIAAAARKAAKVAR